ncbi:MAG TPA: hypothetical protein PKW69_14230 [Niabella sp.]|jgi:hypothetical protein|nr:hypothetical protein [Niabella sp.]
MKTKLGILLGITGLVALIVMKVRSCNDDMAATYWKGKYDAVMSEMIVYKDRADRQVVEQRAAQFDDKVLKAASAKAFNLKKRDEKKVKRVTAFVQVEQQVVVKDTVPINSESNEVVVADGGRTDGWLAVPAEFSKRDSSYSIDLRVMKDYLVIDSMVIYNTISMRLAEKKEGFFTPRVSVIQAVNSNRFVSISGIQSMTIRHKQTQWSKWIKPALFAAAGYAVGRVGR